MKYFNPSYWFKLWVLSAPLFNNKQGINAMSIDIKNIKNWASNNTSLEVIKQEMIYKNSSTNYQPYNLNQANKNINLFYQTDLETSTHKHHHEKHRNRLKRTLNGGNEIEYWRDLGYKNEIYCSFKPEFWEEVENIKAKNEGVEKFVEKFTSKVFNGVWIDYRIETWDDIKKLARGIYYDYWTIANKFIDSSRRERIRIVTIHRGVPNRSTYLKSVNIRTDDTNYYSNIYLDNLQRDFPIWNLYITINLGLINNNIDNDIKNAIKKKYPNFDINQVSVVDKSDYSYLSKIFSAKIYVSTDSQYSFGNLRPTFTYITKTKLKEISNSIANNPKSRQWFEHINEWNSTLPQAIKNAKTFMPELLYNWKRQEKEIIKSYIRDWSYLSTLIEHELKIDELNKNVQGLKANFDSIKNQVNELDKRVTNLENVSNVNCAVIAGITGSIYSVIPVIGTVAGAIATVTSGACAIAGV